MTDKPSRKFYSPTLRTGPRKEPEPTTLPPPFDIALLRTIDESPGPSKASRCCHVAGSQVRLPIGGCSATAVLSGASLLRYDARCFEDASCRGTKPWTGWKKGGERQCG